MISESCEHTACPETDQHQSNSDCKNCSASVSFRLKPKLSGRRQLPRSQALANQLAFAAVRLERLGATLSPASPENLVAAIEPLLPKLSAESTLFLGRVISDKPALGPSPAKARPLRAAATGGPLFS